MARPHLLLIAMLLGALASRSAAQSMGVLYGSSGNTTQLKAFCLDRNGGQASDSSGSYLAFTPDLWVDGAFTLVNTNPDGTSCPPTRPVPELGTAAAIAFDFRAPVQPANCPLSFRLSRYCLTAPTVAISDYIETGIISATTWRRVVVPIPVMRANAGLQPCNAPATASWDLSRMHYQLYVTLCTRCGSNPQPTCHVRNLELLQSLPPASNMAPKITGLQRSISVPAGGLARLPGVITDDGLPQGALVTGAWSVAAAPAGFSASRDVSITPHSIAAGAAWASFAASAPAGSYVLQLVASDGALSRAENISLTLQSWPAAAAITAPAPGLLSGEPSYFYAGANAVLGVSAVLNLSSSCTPAHYASLALECSGPAPCTVVAPTATSAAGSVINASAAFSFSAAGVYTLTWRAVADTSAAEAGFPAVAQAVARAVVVSTSLLAARQVTWQPGSRIPYTPYHPDMPPWLGDPRTSTLPGLMWPPLLQAQASAVVTRSAAWSALAADDAAGLLAAPGACVLIPSGVEVVYDVCNAAAPTLACIVVEGVLRFSADAPTCLRVGTLQAWNRGAIVAQHTAASAAAGVTTTITFSSPRPLDPLEDPPLINVGLQAYHADVILEGEPRCGLRLTGQGMTAGARSFQVPGSQACWRPGDLLMFPDTQLSLPLDDWRMHQVAGFRDTFTKQTELRRVASVAPDGTVALDQPLDFAHASEAPLGLLTRSITLRTDLATSAARAHVLASGHTTYNLRHIAVFDTGRTTINVTGDSSYDSTGQVLVQIANQRGRYGVHSHKARRPVVYHGIVVASSQPNTVPLPRNGLVCHDSHCSVLNNTVVGHSGSGIFIEDGTETGLFQGNLVACSGFGTSLLDEQRNQDSKGKDLGHGGHGFWTRAALISLVDNTVVGWCPAAAYTAFTHCSYKQSAIVPFVEGVSDSLRGANIGQCSNGFGTYGRFEGNTALGTFNIGFSHMYIGVPSLVRGYTCIAQSRGGFCFGTTHSGPVTMEGPVVRAPAPSNRVVGLYYSNGLSTTLRVRGGSISAAYGVTSFFNGTLLDGVALNCSRYDFSFAAHLGTKPNPAPGSGISVARGYGDGRSYVLSYNVSVASPVALPGGMKTDGVAVEGPGPTWL